LPAALQQPAAARLGQHAGLAWTARWQASGDLPAVDTQKHTCVVVFCPCPLFATD
jgi:predicted transporter